jgi:hypothetical protein
MSSSPLRSIQPLVLTRHFKNHEKFALLIPIVPSFFLNQVKLLFVVECNVSKFFSSSLVDWIFETLRKKNKRVVSYDNVAHSGIAIKSTGNILF